MEESSQYGAPDLRVEGRIFATLAAEKQGYGDLILKPDVQSRFASELPEIFLPVPGGWGRMGATHVRLAAVTEDFLAGALLAAWILRKGKNALTRPQPKRGERL